VHTLASPVSSSQKPAAQSDTHTSASSTVCFQKSVAQAETRVVVSDVQVCVASAWACCTAEQALQTSSAVVAAKSFQNPSSQSVEMSLPESDADRLRMATSPARSATRVSISSHREPTIASFESKSSSRSLRFSLSPFAKVVTRSWKLMPNSHVVSINRGLGRERG
jgi:hypothetical protein